MLSDILGLSSGDRAAIVGCGGKTSLMYRLAGENRAHSVLFGTTTRILLPPREMYDREITQDSIPEKTSGIALFVSGRDGIKLMPSKTSELAAVLNAFDYAFFECDGSRGLPLKGWTDSEPVVPDFSTVTVGVCTTAPIGEPVSERNVHRMDEFTRITEALEGGTVTPSHISAMVSHKDGMFKNAIGRRILFINQVESGEAHTYAKKIAELLPRGFKDRLSLIASGSLKLDRFETLWGDNAVNLKQRSGKLKVES